jgi:hypothetical protein
VSVSAIAVKKAADRQQALDVHSPQITMQEMDLVT